jgi:hypothetical protein
MILTPTQIDIMINDTDALAVWHLLTDQGFKEEADYVESRYFEL